MKTDELIAILAANASPVRPNATGRRFASALSIGVLIMLPVLVAVYGMRADLAQVATIPAFWLKLAFPLFIAAASLLVAARLARPGMRVGWWPQAITCALLLLWGLTAFELLQAAPSRREALVFGGTWASCLLKIALLSVPLLAALLWAVKGLAPTRLMLSGAAAGLSAGAISAALYVLHCRELDLPFLGIWYVAGMLLPGIAGAVLGRRLLRW